MARFSHSFDASPSIVRGKGDRYIGIVRVQPPKIVLIAFGAVLQCLAPLPAYCHDMQGAPHVHFPGGTVEIVEQGPGTPSQGATPAEAPPAGVAKPETRDVTTLLLLQAILLVSAVVVLTFAARKGFVLPVDKPKREAPDESNSQAGGR